MYYRGLWLLRLLVFGQAGRLQSPFSFALL